MEAKINETIARVTLVFILKGMTMYIPIQCLSVVHKDVAISSSRQGCKYGSNSSADRCIALQLYCGKKRKRLSEEGCDLGR